MSNGRRLRARARLAGAGLAALALAAVGAAADAQAPAKRLTSEELRALHTGHSMEGCYVDRLDEVIWRERFAADGRLFDLDKGDVEVGSWWIEKGGVVCFTYTDRDPGPHCFTARRRGGHYDFYSAFNGALVATTDCTEPVS